MNPMQQIILIMLKMQFEKFFKGSSELTEKLFINNLNHHEQVGRPLRVGKSHEGKPVIIWESSLHTTMAFYFTEEGFFLSEIWYYNYSTKEISTKVVNPANLKKLKEDIEEIKLLFQSYSMDVDVYFK